jgi:toxin ParE1/3/4
VTAKPVVPRELGNRDIDDALADCRSKRAELAALGFMDAL